MINLGRTEEGPGEKGILDRGLASSRGSRGCWGNAAHDYKRSGIPFQPSKRGAAIALRPFPPSSPHPAPGSAIATMKLRLSWGVYSLACRSDILFLHHVPAQI
jgi:hypothetical protein